MLPQRSGVRPQRSSDLRLQQSSGVPWLQQSSDVPWLQQRNVVRLRRIHPAKSLKKNRLSLANGAVPGAAPLITSWEVLGALCQG